MSQKMWYLIVGYSDNRIWLQVAKNHVCCPFPSLELVLLAASSVYRLLYSQPTPILFVCIRIF